MVYAVLGMHKSGTTLVAEMLHASGIAMGEAMAEGADYDRGHKYEREAVKALNKEILGFDESYRLPPDGPIEISAEQRAQLRGVLDRAQAASTGDWGFKDPRSLLTYERWRAELGEHRLILVYRAPQAVWRHYRKHGPPRHRLLRRLRWGWAILSAWRAYNLRLLEIARAAEPGTWILLEYGRLMDEDAELARLQRFIGRPLPDLRRADRRRSGAGFSPAVTAFDILTGFGIGWTWRDLARAGREG
jgi:hypothetical protein